MLISADIYAPSLKKEYLLWASRLELLTSVTTYIYNFQWWWNTFRNEPAIDITWKFMTIVPPVTLKSNFMSVVDATHQLDVAVCVWTGLRHNYITGDAVKSL